MAGKKELVARLAASAGVTRLLESRHTLPALLVLNLHRVGDAAATPYDSGLFSCSTAEFDEHVAFLKQRFPIVSLDAALELLLGATTANETSILLTFDDGYRDNFDEAFPVLTRHQVPATFFLPTAFVGTGNVPWWDSIAYLVKSSTRPRITLTYPEPREFDLAGSQREVAIREILNLFKSPAMDTPSRFLEELERACGSSRPSTSSERAFLTWDEARIMQQAGMNFGAHTHTHPILTKLSPAGQSEECATSRAILDHELGRPTRSIAYPVGSTTAFNGETQKAARNAGFEIAFSFYGGTNSLPSANPMDVRREAIDRSLGPLFRFRLASLASTGRSRL
ncbi:Polysaccharide deacetylase [Bryocella elongata]|uniref:Polysaccharide deacetylase n=1 Tax=Bryocella elongata TaxID=863522 RepID=A0A1H6BZ08_9BACT|nr:polysaccharide deacetylase family protein [Bryocella elongata]SEG65873.1 Polysaccharide deacetylase [Bryocella elongata]